MLELALVLVMVGMIASIVAPRISAVLTRSSAGQAASVVAGDLEQAVSLASRQRRPVRIACDCAAGTYEVTDRASGTLLFRRAITGAAGGFGATQLTFSPSVIDVFPSGLTSGALAILVGAAGATRQVTMSTGGFVRVVR